MNKPEYKYNLNRPAHLVANAVLRDVEAQANVKFLNPQDTPVYAIVEAHALIHGIKAWAFREGEDDNNGTTIVVFGNGKQIRQDGREYSGDFPALDIEDFFTGFYFDSLFGSLPAQDESLLKA